MRRSALFSLVLAAGGIGSAEAQAGPARPARTYAQQLVDQALAAHPEVTAVELAVVSAQGCRTIAATDATELGETCDADELAVIRLGKSNVEKEKDALDVTLRLHDAAGRVVGAIGMDFPLEGRRPESRLVEQATAIARERAARIPAKAKLFEARASR